MIGFDVVASLCHIEKVVLLVAGVEENGLCGEVCEREKGGSRHTPFHQGSLLGNNRERGKENLVALLHTMFLERGKEGIERDLARKMCRHRVNDHSERQVSGKTVTRGVWVR